MPRSVSTTSYLWTDYDNKKLPEKNGIKVGDKMTFFDRPFGTGPLCISTQALRAWLLSGCPSGTKTIRPSPNKLSEDVLLGYLYWSATA
jgi:hypothetical protein